MQLNGKLRSITWLLLLAYLTVLLKVILFKYPGYGFGTIMQQMTFERLRFTLQHGANFTPFATVAFYLSGNSNLSVVIENVGGNILLFSPLGFLVPIALPKIRGAWRIGAVAFAVSLGLELIQLLTGLGAFDVDDLLLNLLGGIVGWLAFSGLLRLIRKTPIGITLQGGGAGRA